MKWLFQITSLIPWIDQKVQEGKAERVGKHHINHLNERQRAVLIELSKEYERTGQPVPKDRIYNELYIPTWREFGQPSPGGNEITAMFDDLESRRLLERTSLTVIPTEQLLKHMRRIGWL